MYRLVLFMVWPLLAVIDAAKNYCSAKRDRILLLLFSGFIGLNVAITSDGPDINRYREGFLRYVNYDFDYLQNFIINFLMLNDKYYDIGLQFVYYIISRFTGNAQVFFLCLGLIYGLFFSKIITYLGKFLRTQDTSAFTNILFITIFLFFFPTQGINQFRFWTATLCYITGYIILPTSRKKGLFLIFISPLMHIGLGVMIIVFIMRLATDKINPRYLLLLLPVALMLNVGFSSILEPIVGSIGGSVEGKLEDYSGEIAINRLNTFKQRIWYAAYWRDIGVYGLSIINITFLNKIKSLSPSLQSLFRFNLLCLFLALILRGFFMHFRYYEIFIFFQLIFLVRYLAESKAIYGDIGRLKKNAAIIIMCIILMIKIPAILQFLVPTFFVSNLFTSWFFLDIQTVSVWDIFGI